MSTIAQALTQPLSGLAQFGRSLTRLVVTIDLALKVRRERHMLLDLDDRGLKDLGFNRSDAHAEASRSFWDVPVDRLRM